MNYSWTTLFTIDDVTVSKYKYNDIYNYSKLVIDIRFYDKDTGFHGSREFYFSENEILNKHQTWKKFEFLHEGQKILIEKCLKNLAFV